MKQKIRKKKRINSFSLICSIIFGIYCLSLLYPIAWAFIMSLKTPGEYLLDKVSFPKKAQWINYIKAFTQLSAGGNNLFVMFFNSIWYSAGAAFIQVFTCSMVGYVIANYNNRYTKFIHTLSIAVMMIPIVNNLTGQFRISKILGWYDSPLTLVSNFGIIGFAVLTSRAIWRGVDKVYLEAAYVEGAKHYEIPFKFVFPQLAAYLLTSFIMNFIALWNDAQNVLMFLPSYPTVMAGLYVYQEESVRLLSQPILYAGLLMAATPLVILFAIFHKNMMKISITGVLK